jgi:hypothetical protein
MIHLEKLLQAGKKVINNKIDNKYKNIAGSFNGFRHGRNG